MPLVAKKYGYQSAHLELNKKPSPVNAGFFQLRGEIMFMITYYKPSSWIAAGFKRSEGYWRLRIGRLHVARMNNKRASQMLIRELSSKLIKPVIVNCDKSHRQK